MENTLVSFEVAKLAKEKSSIIPCFHLFIEKQGIIEELGCENITHIEDNGNKTNYGNCFWYRNIYNNHTYLRPTQCLLQKWIREKYDIHITIKILSSGKFLLYINHFNLDTDSFLEYTNGEKYLNYEQALEVALFEALKIIK